MSHDIIIDDFVARVNSSKHEEYDLDEVPIPLRVPCAAHWGCFELTDWRIVAADNSARIAALEERLGLSFPPSFRNLICRYSFPAFEFGPVMFFSNTGESLLWELKDRLFIDPGMSPHLIAAGYLQIGNPWFYNYDPVCIEAWPQGVEGRVVQICHEALLCDGALVISRTVSPSFLQLVSAIPE